MTVKIAPDLQVERLILELPDDTRPIAEALRLQVRRNAPALRECIKWSNPFWVGRRDVACLMVYPDHVNLGFVRGADLAEKFPELVGTGKGMRHVKVPTLSSARRTVIASIIRAAARLDASG